MTGVEILSSETIYNTILPEWCAIIGVVLFIALIAPLSLSLADEKIALAVIFLALMIGSFFVILLSDTDNEHDVCYVEHKVTIDDSVSMNEFLDKYEILKQEGKIYTVKEKNKEN